jgi:hypothetical protein
MFKKPLCVCALLFTRKGKNKKIEVASLSAWATTLRGEGFFIKISSPSA